MIEAVKALIKRHWPALRLRTILLTVLLFAAAMPAVSGVFLRVYENLLVRQTEAELVAQGAALAAGASVLWPGAPPAGSAAAARSDAADRAGFTPIDLTTAPILPERPAPPPGQRPIDPAALQAAATLGPIIDRTSRGTLASVRLLDRRGVMVRGPGAGQDFSGLAEVREALAGRMQTVIRRNGDYHPRYSFEWLSRASDVRLHYARPILVNGQVVGVVLLSRSPRALFRGLYEDRGKILFGMAVIFGLLLFLSGLVSRGVTRPIEGLSAASRDVAEGRGEIPETPSTAAVEIRALYEDFRAMAVVIDRRSQYLRDFAAAVSHEFKTPLAGITGAIELLQDHYEAMSAEERARFLDNISADSQRMTHLVTRLLDLVRADMAKPEAGVSADLSRVIHRIADGQRRPSLAIDIGETANLPAVATPEPSLEAVLTVLIENSRQAGARRVRIGAVTSPEAVTLRVEDDGPGVPQADRARLFEPFFTSRRAEGGTGLGLPIARSLLAASHGRIALAASEIGARFEVVLPRAEA